MSVSLKPTDGAILLTGASTGIGADAAITLANQGWLVFACVRKLTDGDTLVEKATIKANLVPVLLDVTNEEQIKEGAATVEKHLGSLSIAGPRKPYLVAIINNAGIADESGPSEAMAIAAFEKTMNVNLYGVIRVTNAFLPLLRQSPKGGRIINVSTIGALASPPFLSPYIASKYALEGYTNSLRWELEVSGQDKIAVSVVRPGAVATAIWDKVNTQEASEKMMAKLNKERMKYYFGEQKFKELNEEVIANQSKEAAPPEVITSKIVGVFSTKSPARVIPAGTDSVALHFIKSWFPESVFYWILGGQIRKIFHA